MSDVQLFLVSVDLYKTASNVAAHSSNATISRTASEVRRWAYEIYSVFLLDKAVCPRSPLPPPFYYLIPPYLTITPT